MRRVRRQVGGVGARRDGRRPPGRRRPGPARRPGAVRRRGDLPHRRHDGAGVDHRLLPAARRRPADYGAIAAANACSDVFAMGGRVVLAINVAAFPEHFPRWAMAAIFDAAAAVVAEAGGTVAGGPHDPQPRAGVRARRAGCSSTPTGCSARAAPGRATSCCCPSRSAPGLTLAGGDDDDKAAAIAGMRPLNRQASELLQSLGAGASTPSPTSPGTASPATAGRSPSAAARASSSTPPGSSPTRGPSRPPSAACAPAATPATATTSPATSTPHGVGQRRGPRLRSADVRRAARRRRAGRRRRAAGGRVLVRRHDRGRRAGGRPAMTMRSPTRSLRPLARWRSLLPRDGAPMTAPVRLVELQEAGADALDRARAVGPRPRRRRRHRRGRPGGLGRPADGRRRRSCRATGGSTASATPSC